MLITSFFSTLVDGVPKVITVWQRASAYHPELKYLFFVRKIDSWDNASRNFDHKVRDEVVLPG